MFNGVPTEYILQVIKKTNIVSFSRLHRSCKWMHELMENNSKEVKIHQKWCAPKLALKVDLDGDTFSMQLWSSPGSWLIVELKDIPVKDVTAVFTDFVKTYSLDIFVINQFQLNIDDRIFRKDFLQPFNQLCQQYKIACYQLYARRVDKLREHVIVMNNRKQELYLHRCSREFQERNEENKLREIYESMKQRYSTMKEFKDAIEREDYPYVYGLKDFIEREMIRTAPIVIFLKFWSIPIELLIKIIRKMNNVTFSKFYRTSKLVKKFLERNAKHITIYSEKRLNIFEIRLKLRFKKNKVYRDINCLVTQFTKKKCFQMLRQYHLQFLLIESMTVTTMTDADKELKTFLSVCRKYGIKCYKLSIGGKYFPSAYDILKPQYCSDPDDFKDHFNSSLLDRNRLLLLTENPGDILFYFNCFAEQLDDVDVSIHFKYTPETASNCDTVLPAFITFLKKLVARGYCNQSFHLLMESSKSIFFDITNPKPYFDYLNDIETLSLFSEIFIFKHSPHFPSAVRALAPTSICIGSHVACIRESSVYRIYLKLHNMFNGVPTESILQVIRKTNFVSFSRLHRSCKWINELIDKNSKSIRIYPQSSAPKLALHIVCDNMYKIEMLASAGKRIIHSKIKKAYSKQISRSFPNNEEFKDIYTNFITVYRLELFVLNELYLQIKDFFEISRRNRIICHQLSISDFYKDIVDREDWWFGCKQWREKAYQKAMEILQPRIWHTYIYGNFPVDKVTNLISIRLTFCRLDTANTFFNGGHIERLDYIDFHFNLYMINHIKCLSIFDQCIDLLKALVRQSSNRKQQTSLNIQETSCSRYYVRPADMESHLVQRLEGVHHHQRVYYNEHEKHGSNADDNVGKLKIWLIPTSTPSRYLFISKSTTKTLVTTEFIGNLREFDKILYFSLVTNGFSNVSQRQKSIIYASVRSLFS